MYRTAGCEIDFSGLPANFGVRALSVFDPDLRRPYQLAYNLGLTHELLRGVAVTAEWFHSDFKNMIARNNVARAASDYTPVTVYSQIDDHVEQRHGGDGADRDRSDGFDPAGGRSLRGRPVRGRQRPDDGTRPLTHLSGTAYASGAGPRRTGPQSGRSGFRETPPPDVAN